MKCPLAIGLAALSLSGCQSQAAAPDPAVEVQTSARIVETKSSSEVRLERLLERAARADAVFLGETHVDELTHRFELAVYEGLIERTRGRVVLALEMFARDAQQVLDAYLAGEIDEAAFLAESSPWANYRTGYRPMIELARERGLPVVGSNVPAGVRRAVSRGGREAYEALTEEQRAWIAPELLPNSEAYWERFVRIVRGHAGQTTDPGDYLYTGQSLWDNTMGFSCAEALEAHPGWVVLHVNGRFHTDFGQGTVDQFRNRAPGARVVTITATPVGNLLAAELDVENPAVADFVAFVDGRARGVQDGLHAVRAGREVRYRLHVPEGAASGETYPLLVWLSGDGLRAEDALAYWEVAFRDEAIVAAVEPPYRAIGEDLSIGGRWAWPETLSDDVGSGIDVAVEVARYVSAYFPVDPERVVLGGEGTGATVAAAAALFGRAGAPVVAHRPRDFRRLRLNGLPEPGGEERGLAVMLDEKADGEWWREEIEAFGPSGLRGSLSPGVDPSLFRAEDLVRERLSLPAVDRWPEMGAGSWDFARFGPPLRRAWSLAGDRARLEGADLPEVDDLPALLAAGEVSGEVLPVPPGPFGGTTLVVVPRWTDEATREAWLALEETDVMAARGSFHRLRVAVEGGEPSIEDVLADLHRSNVLIVPAVFCAEADFMRGLRDRGREHLEKMTATFLPGLGGRLYMAAGE